MILFGSQDQGAHRYIESFIKLYPAANDKIILPNEPVSFLQSNQSNNIDIVLTGSSYGDDTLDKKLWKLASLSDRKSVAIIEHWTWYIERFLDDKQLLFPDQVIVNDGLAYNDAIKSGLPESRLKIIGNPHLELLYKNRASIKAGGKDLRRRLGVPDKEEVVIFLSEILEEDFGPSKRSPLGYTEFDAINLLKRTLLPKQRLYIKPHPAETPNKYSQVIEKKYILDKIVFTDLLGFADNVVGMTTMLLFELALLGEKVISLRPGAKMPFAGELYDLTIPAHDAKSLSAAIQTNQKQNLPKDFMSGSSKKLADLLG